MSTDRPLLQRQAVSLRPDPARVVARAFKPATEPRQLNPIDKSRANHIVDRVLALGPAEAARRLAEVLESFADRHPHLLALIEARADTMEGAFAAHVMFTPTQRRLVGACFVLEYAFEAAALCNPSIVSHPDQTGLAQGEQRIVLSLRAIGEGHISSLTFRTGRIAGDGSVTVDPAARFASPAVLRRKAPNAARGVAEVEFAPDTELGERVIFPVTDAQAHGIEDARFVEFDDDGRRTWYATYTAYSGRSIRSELLRTDDFRSFRMTPLTGPAARNKGMALFPRRLDGAFAMIGRQDNESLYLIRSDDLHHWEEGQVILRPRFAWEIVQIGNCGSPIELDEGWLLLTHGVGPMREYAIGAVLLDKTDPARVLARSDEPLIRPERAERDGYVPNVVYTCGAMRRGERLIVPYAICDRSTTIATLDIAALLATLQG